jgi:hypothetical protein
MALGNRVKSFMELIYVDAEDGLAKPKRVRRNCMIRVITG